MTLGKHLWLPEQGISEICEQVPLQSKHSTLIQKVYGKMDTWKAFIINPTRNIWSDKSSTRSVNAESL